MLVVLPATIVMGFTFPAASTLLGDDPARIAANAGSLLAANTAGAITATFAIPFFVIPAVGSPNAVALLALVNVGTGDRPGRQPVAAAPSAHRPGVSGSSALIVAVGDRLRAATPGTIVDPSVARIHDSRRRGSSRHEDEIASVQAGRHGHAAAVGHRHVDDPADGRREADAGPAAHPPAAVEDAR